MSRGWPKPYASFSAMQTVDQCPARYAYRYRDGIKDPTAEHHIFGAFVHLVAEHSARDKIMAPEPLRALTRKLYDSTVVTNPDWSHLAVDDLAFRKRAWAHIVAIKHAEWSGVLGVPRWLELELDLMLNGVPFRGFVDRVDVGDGMLHSRDVKTGKIPERRDDGAWWHSDRKKFFQTALYNHAIELAIGERTGHGNYIYTLTDPATVVRQPKQWEGAALDWLAEQWAKAERAHTGDAPTNPGTLCGWCSALHLCEDGQQAVRERMAEGKNVPETAVAIVSAPRELVMDRPDPRALREGEEPWGEVTVDMLLEVHAAETSRGTAARMHLVRHYERRLRGMGVDMESFKASKPKRATKRSRKKVAA